MTATPPAADPSPREPGARQPSRPGGATGTAGPDTAGGGVEHVLEELGWRHSIAGGTSQVEVEVVDGLLVPATGLVRMGLLAIVVDLATGQPATGSVTPTVDLRVHVARHRPVRRVRAVSRVLKAGATLFVADCLLHADDDPEPFGTGLATFMNRPVPPAERSRVPGPSRLRQPLDQRVGAVVRAPGVVELRPSDELANPHHGTVQGGIQSLLGELATVSLFDPAERPVVTDLDVRFLRRVTAGPLRASARLLTEGPAGRQVAVDLVDVGSDRLVSRVSTTCAPLAALSGA